MKTFLWTALFLCAWPAVPQKTADLVGERGQASQQFSSAETHFLRGENVKALEAYRKARELFGAAGDQLGQGHAWTGEADVLLRLGDDYEARDDYRHARELFLATADQLGQGDTWRGEARVHDRLGEEKEALEAYETARQLFRTARQALLAKGEKFRLAHTWYGEAEILYRLSKDKSENDGEDKNQKEITRHAPGLYHYREARVLYIAAGNKLGQANTWRGEANVYLRLCKDDFKKNNERLGREDYEKALDAFSKARKLFVAVGDHEGEGDTWFGEEQVRASMPTAGGQQWGSVIKPASSAIANYQSAGVASSQISALLMRAEAEAALKAQRGSPLPVGKGISIGSHVSVSIAVDPVAIINMIVMARRAARSSEEAIRLHGIIRETGTTDADRTQLENEIRGAYDILVPLRARQRGKAAEALRLAEEARSRVLLDLIAAPLKHGVTTSTADPTAERQQLETEISKIDEKLRGSPTLDQQASLRVQRLELELKWNAAGKRSLPQEPPLDTAAIQNLARETGPLLVYYVADSEVWGFLIRPETTEIHARSITISKKDLEQKIDDFVYGLANPSEERTSVAQALTLRALLIDPFIDKLPKSGPLVLVPHGPLHGLPFEALRDAAGKRLFERWQISIAPSVSALAFARHHHATPLENDSFVGFSAGQGLSLPAGEIAKISAVFDKTAYHPTVANYKSYKDHVGQARQLLMDTHGVYTEKSRTETYLEIEPTPDHDSRLTAAEIAKIQLHAELVTLAACRTSHGKPLLSDERLDVTRSFLIAGAAAVVANRWYVPEEEATSRFLVDFYQAYRKGGPGGTGLRKDEALTEARRRSRDERHDPAKIWAGWVLIGDAR